MTTAAIRLCFRFHSSPTLGTMQNLPIYGAGANNINGTQIFFMVFRVEKNEASTFLQHKVDSEVKVHNYIVK